MRTNGAPFQIPLIAVALLLAGEVAIGANPQQPDASTFYAQGVALFEAEKFKEAAKAFAQAIKLRPDYADAHYRLAETYRELGNFEKAVEAYKDAIRYQPDFATAYERLA